MDEIKTYNHEDIQRYLQHKMPALEMHAFEKAMMDDPFLADAIDGFKASDERLADRHLNQIERELRGEEKTKVIAMHSRRNDWWKAAAIIFFIATGALSFLLWNNSGTNRSKQIVQAVSKKKGEARDSVSTPGSKLITDQDSVAQAPALTLRDKNAGLASAPATYKAKQTKPDKESNTLLAENYASKDHSANHVIAQSPVHETEVMQQKNEGASGRTAMLAATAPSATITNSLKKTYTDTFAFDQKNATADVSLNEALQGKLQGLDTRSENVRIRGLSIDQVQSTGRNQIKGKVIDASGKPIAGATVRSIKIKTATYTDREGNFSIAAPDSVAEVIVNSVGMAGEVAKIKTGTHDNNIILQTDKTGLGEVVVVGYGTQKKRDITGSVSAVTEKQLNEKIKRPALNQLSPEPLSGWDAYDAYVKKVIKENKDSTGSTVYDREDVVLEFSIDKKGRPVDITIVRTGTRSDALKAITILKKGSKWISSTKGARVVYTFPFKQ